MEKYKLIFYGCIAEGTDTASVKAKLMDLLKTDATRIEALFNAGATTIKKDIVGYELALKYKAAFDKTGAICEIEEQKTTIKQSAETAPQSTAPTSKSYANAYESNDIQEIPKSGRIVFGTLFIIAGVIPCLRATEVITDGTVYVPNWVLFLFGIAFILAGVLIMTEAGSSTRKFLISLLTTIFSTALTYPFLFMAADSAIETGLFAGLLPAWVIPVIMRALALIIICGTYYLAWFLWKAWYSSVTLPPEQAIRKEKQDEAHQRELQRKGIEQLNSLKAAHKGKILAAVLLILFISSISIVDNFKNIIYVNVRGHFSGHFIIISTAITFLALKANFSRIMQAWNNFRKK